MNTLRFRIHAIAQLAALSACLLWARPASADSVVVVERGDNLFRIALNHGLSAAALARHNGIGVTAPIYVGQQIQIPVASASRPGSAALAAPAQPADASAALHIVQPGDSLYRLALRYGTTTASLAQLNGLRSSNVIYVGQRLVIPSRASQKRLPAAVGAAVPGQAGRHVTIDLSDQRLMAYEGQALVNSFVVSTGKRSTPTPVGDFAIYSRLTQQDMSGPGYYAPGVPWVQYFVGAYAIHGTYWHDSFGLPVSHGCINMRTADAQWLWFWARQGTPVRVQW